MIDFEDQLRSALGRKEPSPDFARTVLAQAARSGRKSGAGWRSWAAGLLAASLLIAGIGAAGIEQRRERERARLAHSQLVQALSITSAKLQRIQRKLEGLNQ